MTDIRKVQKLYNIDLTSVDEDNRQITFCFSDNQPDRQGEIVDQSTWDVKNYEQNPVILWGHDPSDNENVLGQATDIQLNQGGKSFITAQFDDAATNPKADMIFRQLIKRTLRTVSAGFISHTLEWQDDTAVLKDNELLEVSVVAIPANPRAIARSFKDGSLSRKDAAWLLDSMKKEAVELEKELAQPEVHDKEENVDELKTQVSALTDAMTKMAETLNSTVTELRALKDAQADHTKGTDAAKSLPLAPEDTAWDSAEALKRVKAWASDADGNITWTKYATAFFWFDSAAPDPDHDGLPDRQLDYKLPFADVIDGKLTAVWKGVAAAYGALEGAQGGVDLPADDKATVMAAIKGYYDKFGKTMGEKSFETPETKDIATGDVRTKDVDETAPAASDEVTGPKEENQTAPAAAETAAPAETPAETVPEATDTAPEAPAAPETPAETPAETAPEAPNDASDAAKDGDIDQSGAVTDTIDETAELTPELQAQIDAALEQTLTPTAA